MNGGEEILRVRVRLGPNQEKGEMILSWNRSDLAAVMRRLGIEGFKPEPEEIRLLAPPPAALSPSGS